MTWQSKMNIAGNDDDDVQTFLSIEAVVNSTEGASALKDTLSEGTVLAFTTPTMERAHKLRY